MIIKPFKARFPAIDRIDSPDQFSSMAKERYADYEARGWYRSTKSEGLYIYSIDTEKRRHTGIIAFNDLNDYYQGRIKKHEKTLSHREKQQITLFENWGAVLKPVLLTYKPAQPLAEWINAFMAQHPALFSIYYKKDAQVHRIWQIEQPEDIQALQQHFDQEVAEAYIADGHHRTITTTRLFEKTKREKKPFGYPGLYCAYFSTDQLQISDYNRVVSDIDTSETQALLSKMAQVADFKKMEAPHKPRHKFQFCFFLDQTWYIANWKKDLIKSRPPGEITLDANLLNEFVLHDILNINDVRNDSRIAYVDGSQGLKGVKKAVKDRDAVGFVLYPVVVEDMMRIADRGLDMPPKSTYFEPRLKTGLLVCRNDQNED